MTDPVAFAGISITQQEASALRPDVTVLGPAARGEVWARARAGTKIIYLLDGMMVYRHPPPPSEVAAALDSGVTIIGACSIGAMRAVELRDHPLITGTGWVYDALLAGILVGDDELVSRMNQVNSAPINLFVANVVYACRELTSRGAMSFDQADYLISELRQVYFEDRTPDLLRRLVIDASLPARTADLIMESDMNIKRKDAIACLQP